jgi:hypothetical protein
LAGRLLVKLNIKNLKQQLLNALRVIYMPMIAAMAISLRQEDIRSYRNLRLQINKSVLRRFKSLTEGCVPLHIENLGTEVAISIHPAYARETDPPPYLQLPQDICQKADIKAAQEMADDGEWADSEKLAVRSMSAIGNHISILVSRIYTSQILAMKGLPFEDIAWMEAFRLFTNAHIIANDGRRMVLLISRQGGERMAGDEELLCQENAMWTMAVNGSIDYELMENSAPGIIWKDNMLREFDERLGIIGESRIRYLGTVVNTKEPVGAISIIGSI